MQTFSLGAGNDSLTPSMNHIDARRRLVFMGASTAALLAACGGGNDQLSADASSTSSDALGSNREIIQATTTAACNGTKVNTAEFSKRFDALYKYVMGPDAGGDGKVYREKTINGQIYGCCVDTSVYDGNSNTVKSEGQGYGMLLAVAKGDRSRFNRLWAYTRDFMKQSSNANLFDWITSFSDSKNKKLGFGSAPDGEIYIVTALLMASNKWGAVAADKKWYQDAASNILEAIRPQYYDWTVNNLTGTKAKYNGLLRFYPYNSNGIYDASYCNPAFFQYWEDCLPNKGWSALVNGNREYLKLVGSKNGGRGWDYSDIDGNFWNGDKRPSDGYDGCRIALNQALDRWWQNSTVHDSNVELFAETLKANQFGSYSSNSNTRQGYNDGVLAFKAMHATMTFGFGKGCDSRITPYTYALLNEDIAGDYGQYYSGLLATIAAGILGQRIKPEGKTIRGTAA
jgi:endo-1,4-beta-D-glucanase Y